MDILKLDDLAVLKTQNEFVIVVREHIHGPFPNTKEMLKAIVLLLEFPKNEDVISKCAVTWRKEKYNIKHLRKERSRRNELNNI